MQLLEYFYERNNHITTYHQRKSSISNDKKIFLFGSPASGKTSMVLDYLMNFDSEIVLYIDFKDPKFNFIDITEEELERFIKTNKIEILVLDHYNHSYFKILPKIKQLIIISTYYHNYGDKFIEINLPLLDYEEFFSFQKRGTEKQIFNLFLRQGTLPQLATQTIPKEQLFLNFIRSHFTPSEQKLLNVLAHFNGATVTTYQIYTYAKERYKVSKDLIYRQINQFKQQGIITFISDSEQPKQKKLLFFDFALAKYLTLSQSFLRQFETMIALSLHKHKIPFSSFGLTGYLIDKKELILPAPFEGEESFWKKAHNKFSLYKKKGIKRVFIITVGIQYTFTIEEIKFEALPFYEWVVINTERDS